MSVKISYFTAKTTMSRNQSTDALILRTQIQGENNRTITVLSPEKGIFYTTLFGGPKSKLKSLVSPFNRGKLYIYQDETKHSSKITDFDVKQYHPSFRENLFKSWAATFACEFILKTKAGGSFQAAYTCINGLLDGMELTDESSSRLGLIRFIWRYLGILGIRPSARCCCQCGSSFISGSFSENDVNCMGAYDEIENGFVCENCTDLSRHNFTLGKAALTYLEAVAELEPKAVREIVINEQTMTEMKQLCFYLAEAACGNRLSSLESGLGIL